MRSEDGGQGRWGLVATDIAPSLKHSDPAWGQAAAWLPLISPPLVRQEQDLLLPTPFSRAAPLQWLVSSSDPPDVSQPAVSGCSVSG